MSDAVAVDTAVPLTAPRDGIPPVIADAAGLARVIAAFRSGHGPVAVDAERASGYRYTQRAYLVQLRRSDIGTALIDPIACPDLSPLNEVIADAEWVLHAANQDLPCLADLGLRPRRLFDTELAGRLAGYPRVALGTLVELLLGHRLEKGYSAADWSQRPLPEPLLRYAALDVELLIDLRDALAAELDRQGKLGWAREEFAAILASPSPSPRIEPWRRTSGIHRLRNRRQLATLRTLWELRDEIARSRDLAPGRIVLDAGLVAAALTRPGSAEALARLPGFATRTARRYHDQFVAAIAQAERLPDTALPGPATPPDGPPPVQRWADRDAEAAARLTAVRAVVTDLAEQLRVPAENLVPPDAVRRLAWSPPDPPAPDAVAAALRATGARSWQVGLTAGSLAAALSAGPTAQ